MVVIFTLTHIYTYIYTLTFVRTIYFWETGSLTCFRSGRLKEIVLDLNRLLLEFWQVHGRFEHMILHEGQQTSASHQIPSKLIRSSLPQFRTAPKAFRSIYIDMLSDPNGRCGHELKQEAGLLNGICHSVACVASSFLGKLGSKK